MSGTNAEQRHDLMSEALAQLRVALEMLDRAEAPAQIGARVDQAIHELRALLASSPGSSAAAF